MINKFNAYKRTFKLTWSMAMDYRLNFIFNFVCSFVPIIAMIFLWTAIFRDNTTVGGYTLNMMLTYLITARFLHQVIVPDFFWDVSEEIKNGSLSMYLIKPISYIKYWFFKALGNKSQNLVMTIIPILLIALIFRNNIVLNSSIEKIVYFIVACSIAYVLYFLIFMLFSLLSFWFLEISSFFYTLYMFIEFFSGSLIPINLLPATIKNILKYLPFQYLVYFPIKIYLAEITINEIYTGLFVQVIWIAVIAIGIKFLWKLGIKKFEAYGG
ncbi:ABC-2 family transporter protein [Clostridium tepidiprofundi DSM 19306]|uniref:ABC-2 family transporter protein n=1 Tax=Clostridium tepidiprofundi DSM 19306 TaxID=1121338 RepID=A0A151B2X6_9CLOT|nr:ABC-2 family transporter protein [Clostridium tepidiprofundi]KYH34246.1 ABC-2 family transporter protein [Clostridium tepidiprofundi DSM 19306]